MLTLALRRLAMGFWLISPICLNRPESKYPVAITNAVDSFISGSIVKNRNDYQGIVSDILTSFRFSARSNQSDIMIFKVLIWNNEIQNNKMVEFKATVGPGDTAAPVITIMFPSED